MLGFTYKDAAKDFSVQDAIRAHKEAGLAIVVNDGKDITVIVEETDLLMADLIKKSWRRAQ